jgi:hypothetical protein
MTDHPLKLEELGNTYVGPDDRFVVSFIVGIRDSVATTPEEAAAQALDLTRDDGAYGTHFYVFDRQTHTLHLLEQHEFDEEMRPNFLAAIGERRS